MSETKIRKRHEVPVEDTWALEHMFETDDAWERELATLEEDKAYLSSFAGKLGASAADLLNYLTRMEQVDAKAEKLGNYCMRKADQDTRNTAAQAMSGKFMSTVVALGAACSFETPEILAIEDDVLEGFFTAEPGLERYRRYLSDARRMREHILSPAEEKILAAAGEVTAAPMDIFGNLTNADMTFPDVVDGEGNTRPLTQGTFIGYQTGDDRCLRKNAYETLYQTIGSFRNTAAALLNAQGKSLKFRADARKYDSTLQAALYKNNVPEEVYLNLIEAVHQNLDKMHRYVALRKKLLGLDELHFYDIYARLVPGVDRKIPFADAKQTVYDALYPLGESYRAILKEGFENRWIDVYENEGKRAGAYSAGAAVHPYVLLNYNNTLNSQFTLAHEMGHALHSYLSNKHQNPIDAHYCIFVAEVASTCNEALLMQYLLGRTTDKRERAYLINYFLDQFRGTLYRQTLFAEFELIMGRHIAAGRTLTADLLSQEYRKLNELYYGPDIVVDDHIALEWARIPHFYYNYYVFQYATGYSAAMALSRKILSEGEPAVKDYLNFLSGGCSKSPIDLLKDAGVDMTGPEPVNQALKMFGQLLEEMEQLLEEI